MGAGARAARQKSQKLIVNGSRANRNVTSPRATTLAETLARGAGWGGTRREAKIGAGQARVFAGGRYYVAKDRSALSPHHPPYPEDEKINATGECQQAVI